MNEPSAYPAEILAELRTNLDALAQIFKEIKQTNDKCVRDFQRLVDVLDKGQRHE